MELELSSLIEKTLDVFQKNKISYQKITSRKNEQNMFVAMMGYVYNFSISYDETDNQFKVEYCKNRQHEVKNELPEQYKTFLIKSEDELEPFLLRFLKQEKIKNKFSTGAFVQTNSILKRSLPNGIICTDEEIREAWLKGAGCANPDDLEVYLKVENFRLANIDKLGRNSVKVLFQNRNCEATLNIFNGKAKCDIYFVFQR